MLNATLPPTPLQLAVNLGNTDIVKLLLEYKANPHGRISDGACRPIRAAVTGSVRYKNKAINIDIVKLLLQYGAGNEPKVNKQAKNDHNEADGTDKDKNDPKAVDVAKSNPNEVDGAKPNNCKSKMLNEALYLAVQRDNDEVVELLLEYNADPNYISTHKSINPTIPDTETYKSLLHTAVKNTNHDCVRFLVKHGADVNYAANHNCRDIRGKTAFQDALDLYDPHIAISIATSIFLKGVILENLDISYVNKFKYLLEKNQYGDLTKKPLSLSSSCLRTLEPLFTNKTIDEKKNIFKCANIPIIFREPLMFGMSGKIDCKAFYQV